MRYTRACGVCGVFSLSMAAGLLAFSSRQFLHLHQAWSFSLSASHYVFFLSKRSGRRMPPAERSALYYLMYTAVVHSLVFLLLQHWCCCATFPCHNFSRLGQIECPTISRSTARSTADLPGQTSPCFTPTYGPQVCVI